jgi:hypothetical protein
MAVMRVVGALVCSLGLVVGCAEAPPPAPESAGLVLPEWTEPPQRNTGRSKVTHIEQKDGLVYGDPKASNRYVRSKRSADPGGFSKKNNSRFYGGCGALNGEECP